MADELGMALLELLRKAQMEEEGADRGTNGRAQRGSRAGLVRASRYHRAEGTAGSRWQLLSEPAGASEAKGRALVAAVQDAYVQGVSTRRVDDLVQVLGMAGISKIQVSRLCQEMDTEVERVRNRRLEGIYPYLWLDATFVKVRGNGKVVSMAVVGLDVGPSEDEVFWLQFLRGWWLGGFLA
jgi:hypothetical protein